MEGFKKIVKDKIKTEENEIRVTSKGQIKKYLGYALRVFEKTEMKTLLIRATGNAIVKALILIEIVKRRVCDLHQINEITSTEIVDEFERIDPVHEGGEELNKVEQRRRVTCLDCTLSKDLLDEKHIGYQPPQPKEVNPPRENNGDKPRRYNDGGDRPRGGFNGHTRGNMGERGRGRGDRPRSSS